MRSVRSFPLHKLRIIKKEIHSRTWWSFSCCHKNLKKHKQVCLYLLENPRKRESVVSELNPICFSINRNCFKIFKEASVYFNQSKLIFNQLKILNQFFFFFFKSEFDSFQTYFSKRFSNFFSLSELDKASPQFFVVFLQIFCKVFLFISR